MITRCPVCHTHFRVYAEQLAVRAGQVRCGKCSRVFDALEYLIEEIAPARAPGRDPEPAALQRDIADAEPETELAAADAGAQVQESAAAQSADRAAGAVEAAEPAADAAQDAMLATVAAEPANPAVAALAFDFGPVAAAQPDKPVRRWPWLLGAVLLLLLLLAQLAYHYRSAITLLFPETKPYAVALCAALGCELLLPRRIDQMSIEASDLQADTTNPNVMVLAATLRNRAPFNQQHPSLELTLTDAQDQPVVRRVLAPRDYLGKGLNTEAGFAASSEIAIKVFIEGSQVKAIGYRLYLFYP